MSASRSETFASTARRHASVHLTSAPSSREAKVLATRRFVFSFRRSSRLACGPLPSKMACAARCSRLHRWHNWPPGRLPVWHRGGVPSPNLMHLSMLLSAIVVKNEGETMSDVLVSWCQLLKWEKHSVFALRGMPMLATSVHADERACVLSFCSSRDPPASSHWRYLYRVLTRSGGCKPPW